MKTFRANIIRMIRSTKSRFFSLTAIVAIGVAFFVGVSAASIVMGQSVDRYNDEQRLKDITIYSNYGFEDEDLKAVQDMEQTETAEGTWFADVIGTTGDSARITRVHAYDPNAQINVPVLVEGRMPERPDEALSEMGSDLKSGFGIGETVYFNFPEGTSNDSLLIDHATVVGMIDTPVYLNQSKETSTLSNQYLDTYLYVPHEAFDQEYYTEINVTVKGLASLYSYSKEYDNALEEARGDYDDLAEKWQDRRRSEIVAEADEAYQEGLQEYQDGLKEYNEEIAEAQQKIDEGEKEISQGEKELEEGEQELAEGMAEMERQKQAALQELDNAQRTVDENRRKLEESRQEFEQTKQDLLKQKQELEESIPKLQEAKDGLAMIDSSLPQVQDGIRQLEEEKVSLMMDVFRQLPADTKIEDIREGLKEAARISGELNEVLPEIPAETWTDAEDTGDRLAAQVREDAAYCGSEDAAKTLKYLRSLKEGKKADPERIQAMADLVRRYDPVSDIDTPTGLADAFERISPQLVKADELLDQYDTASMKDILHLVRDGKTPEMLEELSGPQMDTMISSLMEISGRESIATSGELVSAYDESLTILRESETQLLNGRQTIVDALAQQGIKEEELDSVMAQASAGITQIDEGIRQGEQQIAEGEKQLNEAQRQIDEGRAELAKKLADAQNAFTNGAAEIAYNRRRIGDARSELASGKEELAKAKEEGLDALNEAKKKLDEAREEIDSLEPGEWTVLDRSTGHYATVTYRGSVDQMHAIGNIFPLFFIAVAALVCLTTMTRMVDEQRGEIGILRALGYTEMQCASKYLIYAATATLLGEIIGIVFGMMTFPLIIYHVWRMMYVLPPVYMPVPWGLILAAGASFLAGMELTTWLTCRKDMQEVPSQLMRPKSPKLGRKTLLERIRIVWNRLSFTWKVTMRNLFRYKRRFFMTVAGVAGCTALLVTGFGIRDSINSMVDLQFYEISRFDGSVSLARGLDDGQVKELTAWLDGWEDIEEVTEIGSYTAKVSSHSKEETATVEIYTSDEAAQRCYDLRVRTNHEPLHISGEGVLISEKLSELLSLKTGDTIRLEGENGKFRDVPVAGITELYIYHYVFMTEDYYRSVFGIDPVSRSLHLKLAEGITDTSGIQRKLVEREEIDGIAFFEAVLDNFRTMVKGLDLIVWTLIVSSMSLAFVVLGNLINVNLSERTREIATLKVLGFRRREVENYIYKENNVLTVIGALCGLPVGNLLHHYIMRMVEMSYVMFGRSILPMSFVISIALTVVFSMMVNAVMARRLHSIQMVESLKSVE